MSLGQGNDRGPVGIVIGLQQLGGSEQYCDAHRGEGQYRHGYLSPAESGRSAGSGWVAAPRRVLLAGQGGCFRHLHTHPLIVHLLVLFMRAVLSWGPVVPPGLQIRGTLPAGSSATWPSPAGAGRATKQACRAGRPAGGPGGPARGGAGGDGGGGGG